MPEFFSSDGSLPLQFLVIFSVIVVLLMAAYLLFRRIAGRGLSLSSRAGNRTRQPRLGIVDIYELDRQRQLILLRRDNVEHLLLVGGPNDVVVERNVQRGAGSRLPAETMIRPEPAPDMPDMQTQNPPFQPSALQPPSFEMPVVVPTPLPGSTQTPEPQAPRLDPTLFEPDAAEPEPTEPVPSRGRTNRFLRRTPPPLVNPRPEVASERAQGTEATTKSDLATDAPPRLEAEAIPPVMAVKEPRTVDPAVLSDMARQLEVALQRPSSAVTPPPGPTPRPSDASEPVAEASEPPPAAPEPASRRPLDPMAARMAASQAQSRPEPEPEPPPPAPAPAPAAHAPGPPAALFESRPVPEEASAPEPPPAQPARPERKPDASQAAKPFSVEEIEAEFARLLGRPLDKKG